jgi:Omp85 superfamily domain
MSYCPDCLIRVLFVVCLCIPLSPAVIAQDQQPLQKPAEPAVQPAQSTTPTQTQTEEEKKNEKEKEKAEKPPPRGAFVVAPLPISSPALGSGIVPVLAYIFPISTNDKVSPPSVVGAAGLITNNGSRALAIGGELFLKENRYRITAAYVRGNLDYDVYGTGVNMPDAKLPLVQTGQAFFGEALRRVGWQFFVGPRFVTGRSTITVKPNESTVPIPPDAGLDTSLISLGFRILRDTSPNRFYPTSGSVIDFTADFFAQGLGSKYSFQSYKATYNKYWSVGDKQVLAYNAFFCGTGGAPPFYGNCIYGTNNQLRGYAAGQYFTSYMLGTQVEYRQSLRWRFGFAVFGGVGEAIPGSGQIYGAQKFLPAGGGGLRFMLSKKYHVNLRADIAQGVNGHTFGVGVGEAF